MNLKLDPIDQLSVRILVGLILLVAAGVLAVLLFSCASASPRGTLRVGTCSGGNLVPAYDESFPAEYGVLVDYPSGRIPPEPGDRAPICIYYRADGGGR